MKSGLAYQAADPDAPPPVATADGWPLTDDVPIKRAGRLHGDSSAWTWAGVGVSVIGFVLIALAWGQVAGETDVYRQLPYVVSAGFVGLGLVMVGLTVVNVVSRYRDGNDNDDRMEELITVLADMKQVLSDLSRPPR